MRTFPDAFTAQRSARASGRFDRAFLPLSDAGHGSTPGRNPVLWGSGVQLHVQLGTLTRTWAAYLESEDPVTGDLVRVEITSEFDPHPVVARRHVLRGRAGVPPLALPDHLQEHFATPVEITLVVEARNVELVVERRWELVVRDGGDLGSCVAAEDCDLDLLGPVYKARVRPYSDLVNRDDNVAVSFLFDQLDLLLARVPGLSGLLPEYRFDATVGVEFGVEGDCGARQDGGLPRCGNQVCCCQINPAAIAFALEDITSPLLNPVSIGVNQFDIVEVVATIPTGGPADCLGFDVLQVILPGNDTTGGVWQLYDPLQPGGFLPTATVGGAPVVPTFSQNGIFGGDGSGNQGLLSFSGIPISCGDEIVITFRVQAMILNAALGAIGQLSVINAGACSASGSAFLPLLFVGEGMTSPPITPPDDPPGGPS